MSEVDKLLAALQTILDMPCPMSREGDLLGKAQIVAATAIGDFHGEQNARRA